MEGFVAIVIITLFAITAGLIVWGCDKNHAAYGAVLPTGVAVSIAMIAWIVLTALGLSENGQLAWIPWIVPILTAVAVAIVGTLWLGNIRHKADTEQLTLILKQQ